MYIPVLEKIKNMLKKLSHLYASALWSPQTISCPEKLFIFYS